MRILWAFIAFVALLLTGCKNDNQQTTDDHLQKTEEVQILEDTLLAITNRGLIFSNGTSEMLPFADDSTATVLIMARHAEKDTVGDDPVLTEAGNLRAEKLSAILQDLTLHGVYSTQFVRTMKTAQPSALSHQQPILIYDPKETNFIQNLVEKNPGKHMLIVGHSNSTPELINQLLDKEQFKEIDEKDYSNIFIVAVGNSGQSVKVVRARF